MSNGDRRPSERMFADLRSALDSLDQPVPNIPRTVDVRLDTGRRNRQGNPEVIYAAGKTPDQIREAIETALDSEGRVLVSRVDDALMKLLATSFPGANVDFRPGDRMARFAVAGSVHQLDQGIIGIVTAGTSDLPVAGEAHLMAEEMGCQVDLVSDVGVAGLHRLIAPLAGLLDAGVQALIVVAGMDGALPSVVAGLVSIPVIGVPTSTGYGVGGRGEAALLSMLQTCAPGLTVVNVDNGIGAGIAAARIANAITQAEKSGG